MKTIHINPQSKGNLGKSFELECRAAYLDAIGVSWYGFDLDDRHHSFLDRHPEKVELVSLDNNPKDGILSLIKAALSRPESVMLIDCRAQADAIIIEAFNSLNVFARAAQDDTRFLISLFPSDDNESLANMSEIAKWGAGRADFLIVKNPSKSQARMFETSSMRTTLIEKLNAREVTVPAITETTLTFLEKAERQAGRAISFNEFANGWPGVDWLITGEIGSLLGEMARQYGAVAAYLLPESELAKVPVLPAKTAKPAETFNFSLD